MIDIKRLENTYNKKVIKYDNDCWGWKGSTKIIRGAACVECLGKIFNAREVSWRIHIGDIPDGYIVSSSCNTISCTNPKHLKLIKFGSWNANTRTLKDTFYDNVSKNDEDNCWEWLGTRFSKGYGSIWDGKKNQKAHRVSWEIHHGKIPEGMIICHHCDNPSCVNPNHLFIGTDLDNARDRESKNRGNVPKGENSPNSKLTEQDIKTIRYLYSTGNYTLQDLSDRFGVVFQQISRIVNRTRWKHVE